MMTQNSIALEAQVEERPLAKAQEQLADIEEVKSEPVDVTLDVEHPTPHPAHAHKKALLKSEDSELHRVRKVCAINCTVTIIF